MNVLEKILEEIDKIKDVIKAPIYDNCFGDECGDNGDCMVCVCEKIMDIIRSHMDDVENDGWIPVSEGLPEPDKIVYVTVHCSEWISDYDSDWVTENEKVHHEEKYIVNVGYVDEDWHWTAFNDDGCAVCCDEEFGTDKGCVYSVVTAWLPLPEPYKGE
mgnify:CR=1 FL=1